MARLTSLKGDTERLLHEAVKAKPELQWRLQEVRDTRTMRYTWRKAFWCRMELALQRSLDSRDVGVWL